jgi:hypothetical protein
VTFPTRLAVRSPNGLASHVPAMCRTFAELDYTPLVGSGRVPAMVTLTYPDDRESVVEGASVKRHMVLWRKRFQREWGEPARYIWKLEFQRRGAPHIHLCMAPPHAAGRSGRKFHDWLSQEWADIVAHLDPNNAHATCSPARLSTSSTDCAPATQALGDLPHQTLITESIGRQGIPAHHSGSLATAGPRIGSLLGRPRAATSNRSRGDRSGRVPDGPKDHPSLVRKSGTYTRRTTPLGTFDQPATLVILTRFRPD